MTRSVEIPEEAADAAWTAYSRSPSGGGRGGMRAALLAALPYLAPAERPVLDRAAARRAIYTALFGSPEGTYDNVEVALDAVMALARSEAEVKAEALREAAGAPAGDGGLREALEAVLDQHECTQPDTPKFNRAVLDDLLAAVAAHPAAPAVPQPADDLERLHLAASALADLWHVPIDVFWQTREMHLEILRGSAVPQPVDREALERDRANMVIVTAKAIQQGQAAEREKP